jgi:tetratricopeptide (TPR) repeat protein
MTKAEPLNPAVAQLLAQAQTALAAGRPDSAHSISSQAMTLAPQSPEVLTTMGVTLRRLGRVSDAIAAFRQAVAGSPDFGPAWSNLGAAFISNGQFEEAISALDRALTLTPRDGAAAYNLGNARLRLGDFAGAISALEHAAQCGHPSAPVHEALGLALHKSGRYALALAAFDRAIKDGPKRAGVYHNRSLTLQALGRVAEAEDNLRTAVSMAPQVAESAFALGNFLRNAGRPLDALPYLRRAVELEPGYLLAHQVLNETLWQAGQGESYLASYPAAIYSKPNDRGLRLAYGQQLLRTLRPAEALTEFETALAMDAQSPVALDGKAQALAALGRFEAANDAAGRAAQLAPQDPAIQGRKGELLLRSQRFGEAIDALRHAISVRPLDQENLARLSTAYRCAGEAQAHLAFADPESLAVVSQLEPPEGFKDIESFNRALADQLRTLHTAKQHPTDQTLRGGTQTLGSLFAQQDPLIQQLKAQLEKAIARVIGDMPDRSAHPFYQRKSPAFRFAGSWSVLLKTQGFHTNHIHPAGWISSAYYINLPEEVEGAGHEGWFKIGETNPDTLPLLPVERWVKPQSGSLVLFPSYMWHGTQAFARSAERLTVAFDVVPD